MPKGLTEIVELLHSTLDNDPAKAYKVGLNALDKYGLDTHNPDLPRLLNNLGLCSRTLGDQTRALDYYEQARKLYEIQGHQEGLGIVHMSIGNVQFTLGEMDLAKEHYTQARDIAQSAGNLSAEALMIGNIGNVYFQLGESNEALKNYHFAIDQFKKLGEKNLQALYEGNVGLVYHGKKDLNEALNWCEKALATFREISERLGSARNMINIGSILLEKKEYQKAETILLEGLQILEEMDAREYLYQAHHTLYELYELKNDIAKALKHFKTYHEVEKEVINAHARAKATNVEMQWKMELIEKEVEIEKLRNVELKAAYDQLESAQRELVRQERMATLGKVAQQIAHEIQNPMNFINNFSDINSELINELLKSVELNSLTKEERDVLDQVSRNSETIKLQGEKVGQIIGQLLQQTFLVGELPTEEIDSTKQSES